MTVNKILQSNHPGILQATGYATAGIVSLNLPAGNYQVYCSPPTIGAIGTNTFKNTTTSTLAGLTIVTGTPYSLFFDESALSLTTGTQSTTTMGAYSPQLTYSFVWDGTNLQVTPSNANLPGTIYYSTNGASWQYKLVGSNLRASTHRNGIKSFVYNANVTNKYIFCTATNSTTTAVWTSTDSVTWTSRTLPVAPNVDGCVGVLINSNATNKFTLNNGNTSNMIIYSTDAVTWTQATVNTGTNLLLAACATNNTASTNEIYIYSVNNTVNNIITSTDAVTWTSRTTGVAALVQNMDWFVDKYIVSYVSNASYSYSTNGTTWTTATYPLSGTSNTPAGTVIPTSIVLNNLIYHQGANNVQFVSTDGITWSRENLVGPTTTAYWFRSPLTGLLAAYTQSTGVVNQRQPLYYAFYRMAQ